jgi:hypothetical protein
MNKLTFILLIPIFFISSCNPVISKTPISQPLPSPSGTWSVKMTQSGGIAGVLLTVEVTSDGQLKAEDQRSHRSISRIISTLTTDELKMLIFNMPVSGNRLPQTGCADCFIYNLEIHSEGKNQEIQVDDVSMKDSGAQELITTLIMIRDGALKPNP